MTHSVTLLRKSLAAHLLKCNSIPMSLDLGWRDVEWVAFDTETSGKYPLDAEICELAAVKWKDGEVIDTFSTLLSVKKPMGEEVIAIHKITNEMLEGAPKIDEKLPEFIEFLGNGYLLAHHIPFDMGFLAIELERMQIPFPKNPGFCTSLLSRNLIPQAPNHRLQTLVEYLEIPKRTAHRALSDAEACLDVGIKCFEVFDKRNVDLKTLQNKQGRSFVWSAFSIQSLKAEERFVDLVEALVHKSPVQIKYSGGSRPGQARTVKPIGIVRSPGQDFLVAKPEAGDDHPKRYYLNRITSSQL